MKQQALKLVSILFCLVALSSCYVVPYGYRPYHHYRYVYVRRPGQPYVVHRVRTSDEVEDAGRAKPEGAGRNKREEAGETVSEERAAATSQQAQEKGAPAAGREGFF